MDDANPSLPDRGLALRALLEEAGRAAMQRFSALGGAARTKADGSPVTEADLAAERVLVAGLRAAWPRDGIRSEEGGGVFEGEAACWLVDPIDGTSAFVEGLAHWGPTIARMERLDGRSRLDCGALWLPRIREHYHVEGGRGWFDGRLLPRVRTAPRVIYLPSEFHRFARLDWDGKTRGLGGTAAHLALVARGAAQAAIVAPGWAPWDTATGLALIEATGGLALRFAEDRSSVAGGVDPVRDAGAAFVAGVPEVVEELVLGGRLVPFTQGAAHGR